MLVAHEIRNNRVSRVNNVAYCSELLYKPPAWALRFSHQCNGHITEAGTRDNEPCNLLLWPLCLEALLYLWILINSGKML